MPTEHIVALLIAERDKLDQAIEALGGGTKRRGRPRKNPSAKQGCGHSECGPAKKLHMRTLAARKAQAQRNARVLEAEEAREVGKVPLGVPDYADFGFARNDTPPSQIVRTSVNLVVKRVRIRS